MKPEKVIEVNEFALRSQQRFIHSRWQQWMLIVLLAGNVFVLLSILSAPLVGSYLARDVAAIMNKAVVWSVALFVAPLFVVCVGLFRAVGVFIFLLVFVAPFIYSDPGYTWRAKLQEGVNLSNPHRTTIEIDCSENTMQPRSVSEFHEHMELEPPDVYKGTFIESVSAETYEHNRGRVTIVVSQTIKDDSSGPIVVTVADPGDSLIFDGTCTPEGMEWKIGSSLPVGYRNNWTQLP